MSRHGAPDWTPYNPDLQISPAIDVEELAVKLGGMVIPEHTGRILYIEQWEYGITSWDKTGLGTAAADTTYYFSKGRSILLTSSSGGSEVVMSKTLPGVDPSKIGIACVFSKDYGCRSVKLRGLLSGPVAMGYYWGLRAVFPTQNTGELHYWGEDGAWHKFADLSVPDYAPDSWQSLKVVFDAETGYYVRAEKGSREWDISEYHGDTNVVPEEPNLSIYLAADGRDTTGKARLDDIVVTDREL